ncbi:MAG: helix-turn-helix transcriptional regulator [Taibaiella sp.]|jgi:transcriptional regulator with XRE-family HTH domain
METIGTRIATYRHSLKWTQDRLADELSIPRSMLSDIENDKISPKLELLDKIAQKLNVPINQLLPSTYNIISHNSDTAQGNGNVNNYNNGHSNEILLDMLAKVLETQNRLIALLDKQGV